MNPESENGPKPRRRGLWKWLLGGTVLVIAVSVLAVLMSDDALLPYDDLKVAEAPVPDAGTNGYLYLSAKWERWPRTESDVWMRVKAMIDGQEPPDQAFIDRLRKGREISVEDLRAALAMPEWRFPAPVNGQMETGLWMRLPVQLLAFDAMASLRAGDAGPAIALQQEMALWIKRQLEGGGGFSALVTVVVFLDTVADLGCAVLALGNPDADQLEIMDRIWSGELPMAEAWRSAIRNEGAQFRGIMGLDAGSTGGTPGRFSWREKLLFKKNRTFNAYHDILRKLEAARFQPFPSREAARQASLGKQPESERLLLGRWDLNAVGNWCLSQTRSWEMFVPWQYKMFFTPRAMRVRLAVHRWRQAHPDQWPASLTELVPDFLPEVPADPWNGAPLLWDQATRTVYAVGEDWSPDLPDFRSDNRGWASFSTNAPGLRMELPPADPDTPRRRRVVLGNP